MESTTAGSDAIDPDFAARLEWQLRTALRRESRFARPARGAWRMAKVAAIVVAALSAGASATLAIQHVQESQAAQLRGHIASLELARAVQRQQRCAEAFARVDAAFTSGVASTTERGQAELLMKRAIQEVLRRRLDLEETEAGGRAPDDSLAAPRVGGRDFPGARLDVDLADANATLAAARVRLDLAQALLRAGAASDAEVVEARADVARGESEIVRVRARADLRARFLAGELSAARVEWLGRIADNAAAQASRAAECARARERAARIRTLSESGFAASGEVAEEEAALADAQAELQILRDERALLDAELAAAR